MSYPFMTQFWQDTPQPTYPLTGPVYPSQVSMYPDPQLFQAEMMQPQLIQPQTFQPQAFQPQAFQPNFFQPLPIRSFNNHSVLRHFMPATAIPFPQEDSSPELLALSDSDMSDSAELALSDDEEAPPRRRRKRSPRAEAPRKLTSWQKRSQHSRDRCAQMGKNRRATIAAAAASRHPGMNDPPTMTGPVQQPKAPTPEATITIADLSDDEEPPRRRRKLTHRARAEDPPKLSRWQKRLQEYRDRTCQMEKDKRAINAAAWAAAAARRRSDMNDPPAMANPNPPAMPGPIRPRAPTPEAYISPYPSIIDEENTTPVPTASASTPVLKVKKSARPRAHKAKEQTSRLREIFKVRRSTRLSSHKTVEYEESD